MQRTQIPTGYKPNYMGRQLNYVEAGYRAMMILTSDAVAKYSVAKGKIVIDFLAKNYNIDIDIDKENKALLEFKGDFLTEFSFYVNMFNAEDDEVKLDFLAFLYRIVAVDDKEKAKKYYKIASAILGVDSSGLLDNSLLEQLKL